MSKAKPIVSIVKSIDGTKGLEKAFSEIARTAMYVGIASGSKKDTREDGAHIRNSELGFIHEFGSPSANIPARPFLAPGVKSVKNKIQAQMGIAVKAMLGGDSDKFNAVLERTALSTADDVRAYVRDHNASFAPLAPVTRMLREIKIQKAGGTPGDIKILMDTNSLMRAIDGVVVKE